MDKFIMVAIAMLWISIMEDSKFSRKIFQGAQYKDNNREQLEEIFFSKSFFLTEFLKILSLKDFCYLSIILLHIAGISNKYRDFFKAMFCLTHIGVFICHFFLFP